MPGILDYIEVLTPIFLKIFSLLARCTVEKYIFVRGIKPNQHVKILEIGDFLFTYAGGRCESCFI
jgi:hypothetical protein